MKHAIKFCVLLTLMLFIVGTISAQTESATTDKSEIKICDVNKCDPALCDMMVKAGICTKEQAEKCKAICGSKSTKVAAASMERVNALPETSTKPAKKASCAKTCVKTCATKKKGNTE